eukprot:gnl/MRDRNA2_/MRDRNA2_149865_c0_seq1.p1 gnl/MRDRNA2_/MRDRNA2_149865_c0~~gnl/MRDRNA2_/MRDRNA2_149865_c0_seq1.p1  ORF type:complete len:270 (-),score=51.86 gnl/MRDRNA2_/MRDRNA2_149865_c0_seq1:311-1120(-)
MNEWAKGSLDCHFICICVLGDAEAKDMALEFGKQLKLTTTVNGFIDNRGDMPRKGQLGCSGFIILDRDLNTVSACTSAFMQVRERAFKDVEKILATTMTKNGASDQVSKVPKQNGGYGTGGGGDCGLKSCCSPPSSVPQVLSLKELPSVKVESMDAEHEECANALNVLAEQKTQDALRSVHTLVEAHFKHEEALLDKSGWGGDVSDAFSAKGSHFKDHNRILQKLRNELQIKRASIPVDVIKSIMQDFEEHAVRYDVHYADHLSALGVH